MNNINRSAPFRLVNRCDIRSNVVARRLARHDYRILCRLHGGSIRAIVTLIVEMHTGTRDGLGMRRRRHTGAERTEHQRMRAAVSARQRVKVSALTVASAIRFH